jgi:3'-phosphoadenosine 5'-phosphosulfate sulfotransferase (PAPS reductase)/FAD synthetase
MHVLSVSYGNDSIALIQWAHERALPEVSCVYCETGWASDEWAERVERGEALARSYGFNVSRVESSGFVELARLRKSWPRNGMQFCTSELKIRPFGAWLDARDPDLEAVVCVGVRRAESARRASWPEHVEESAQHGGRALWSPLVRLADDARNALILRAGFDVLPHRSRECWPCVNSGRSDLRMLDERRIAYVEALERDMGYTSTGKPRTLFRPAKKGGAVGIREVKRWADAERGEYEPPESGCDSGMCGG